MAATAVSAASECGLSAGGQRILGCRMALVSTQIAQNRSTPFLCAMFMPGNSKECRKHATRCAEMAVAARTPQLKATFLVLSQELGETLQFNWKVLSRNLPKVRILTSERPHVVEALQCCSRSSRLAFFSASSAKYSQASTIASNVALVLRSFTFAAIRRHSAAYRLCSPDPILVRPTGEPRLKRRNAIKVPA